MAVACGIHADIVPSYGNASNTERLGKNLWTEKLEGEQIVLYQAYNEQDEARFVADVLRDWMNKGEMYEDAAVLYRSNAQSRALEEALLRASIPYRIYGGQRFYERMEIKNAIAYLKIIYYLLIDNYLAKINMNLILSIYFSIVEFLYKYTQNLYIKHNSNYSFL